MDLNPALLDSILFSFDFQVWRPSPIVNETGCYSLVDNFAIISTPIPVSPAIEHVARVTPLPQNQLRFQPGDVLGFYVESHGTGDKLSDNGVVLLNNGSHPSELVWFASIAITAQTSQSGSCPYPVGTTGVLNSLTRAAPVISISVMTTPYHHTTTSSLQVYPTSTNLAPTEIYDDVNPFSSSTTLVVVISVVVFVVVILSTIVAMTVMYCVKCHRKSIPTSINDVNGDRHDSELYTQTEHTYDYPNVNTMASMELKINQAYGKLTVDATSPNIELKQNEAYA